MQRDGLAVGRAGAQITPKEATALREALRAGQLTVRPSIAVIDELLCELDSDRPGMVRKLRTMRSLGNVFQQMLKLPSDLLRDSIKAYANGGSPPDILLAEDQRRVVVKSLAEVCAGSASPDLILRQIAEDVRAQKAGWEESMRTGQAEVPTELQARAGILRG
jgi:hypothetical protein